MAAYTTYGVNALTGVSELSTVKKERRAKQEQQQSFARCLKKEVSKATSSVEKNVANGDRLELSSYVANDISQYDLTLARMYQQARMHAQR